MLGAFYATTAQRGLGSPYDAEIYAYAGDDLTLVWLVKALIARESGWNPAASRAEPQIGDMSIGLMQILMATANQYEPVTVNDLFDPRTNLRIGIAHVRMLLGRYGRLDDVISAYNAGRPVSTNRAYVDDVLAYYVFYVNNEPALPADLSAAEAERQLDELELANVWTMQGDGAEEAPAGVSMGGLSMALLVIGGLFLVSAAPGR